MLVHKSLDAERLADGCLANGFKPVSEDAGGLILESQNGRLILGVLASRHPTNMFTLIYKDLGSGLKTVVVEGGKKQRKRV